ncbi:MAG: hypothetical protein AB7O66_10975 [Limisphaerales bacterium]
MEPEVLRVYGTDTDELPFPAVFYTLAPGPAEGSLASSDFEASPAPFVPLASDSAAAESLDSALNLAPGLAARANQGARFLKDRYSTQHSSILAAMRSNQHPERLSPDFPPKPFTPGLYARDPDAYLGVVEPGRCWQTAPDESRAPILTVVGGLTDISILAGRASALEIQVPAGAPATFTSFGGGTFPNGLNSISVEADPRGRASTTWTASPGTVGEAMIVAASPVARGSARFTLTVVGPTTSPQIAITPSRKRGAR